MIDPTMAAALRSLEIVVAYLVQILVMHVIPPTECLLGAGLVLISVVSISLESVIVNRYIPSRIRAVF